jgi:UPF0755 protein
MTEEAPETLEGRASAPRRSPARRIAAALVLFLALLGIGAALGGYLVYEYVRGPGVEGEPVTVLIPEGASGRQVGDLVAKAGLVEQELFFRLAMRLDRSGGTIKHGEHHIPRGLSPSEILRRLQEAPEAGAGAFKVTVPEGLTIAQIASLVGDSAGVLAAASAIAPKEALGIDAPGLEGFLMPDTYYFDAPPSGEELVRRMLKQFREEWTALSAEFPEAARDPLKILTVASLVEEEARVEEERPLVAAVIYNRLAAGRPLQMDSTLQYALKKYGQRLLDEDKEIESPYNTYKVAGLPPGPISNPGRASLRAALAPANVKHLYFVSNADGKTHTFSTTLREHEAAVAKFRKEIRVQRKDEREEDAGKK